MDPITFAIKFQSQGEIFVSSTSCPPRPRGLRPHLLSAELQRPDSTSFTRILAVRASSKSLDLFLAGLPASLPATRCKVVLILRVARVFASHIVLMRTDNNTRKSGSFFAHRSHTRTSYHIYVIPPLVLTGEIVPLHDGARVCTGLRQCSYSVQNLQIVCGVRGRLRHKVISDLHSTKICF